MARKIIKIGSSAGVTIPKPVMKRLNLSVGDEVIVDDDGNEIRISAPRPVSEREQRIAELTENFINRYRSDLEALADK